MSNKDKKILALTSGAFLSVLAFILFFTMQVRDNMISNTARVKGIELADETSGACVSWGSWYEHGSSSAWSQECTSYSESAANSATEENMQNWYRTCNKETDLVTCTEQGFNAPCYRGYTEYSRNCLERENNCLSGEYYDGTACRSCAGNTNNVYPSSEAGSTSINQCYLTLAGGYEVIVQYAQASQCADGYVQEAERAYYGSTARCTKCPDGKKPNSAKTECIDDDSGGSTATSCLSGEYYDSSSNSCKSCSSATNGIYINSTAGEANSVNDCYMTVPAGHYVEHPTESHKKCPSGYYNSTEKTVKYGETSTCEQCPNGQVPNTNATGCDTSGTSQTEIKCCVEENGVFSYTTVSNASQCYNQTDTIVQCLNRNNNTEITESECRQRPNSYYVNSQCVTCLDGYIATNANNDCHIDVPAGSYLATASGSEIRFCPTGSYSSGHTVVQGNVSTCTTCPNNQTSKIGATSIDECYDKADASQCTVTASTSATLVSNGSHYNVNVSVSGDGCNGQTMTLSISKAYHSGSQSSWNVSDGQSFNFTIIQNADCDEYSSVTANLSGGVSSNTVTVAGTRDWYCVDGVYPYETYKNEYHTKTDAENNGADVYYASLSQNNYTIKCIRGCGSSGGTTPSDDPTPPTTTIYCWKKLGTNGSENSYTYSATSPGSGWTKIGESGKVTCSENEACYQVGNSYVIGMYDGVAGYEYKGETCPSEPTPTNYCWIKRGTNGSQNQYTTGTTAPSSEWERYGVVGSVTCSPTSSCYKASDGSYVIGDYDGVAGYTKYGSTCPSEACYYNPLTGAYRWTDTPTYNELIVTSITKESDCKTPTVTYKCYVNTTTNDYKWATTSPGAGYVEDPTINTPQSCVPPEAPACYENLTTGNREWGLYKQNVGYNLISSDKKDCEMACYKNKNTGRLVWGYFNGNNSYEITNINEKNCNDVIDNVPKTSASISTIIYIMVAIFAITGFGFIIYTNYNKKKI